MFNSFADHHSGCGQRNEIFDNTVVAISLSASTEAFNEAMGRKITHYFNKLFKRFHKEPFLR